MWKYIVTWWIIIGPSDLVVRLKYDAACQCMRAIENEITWRADTLGKREFNYKKNALKLIDSLKTSDFLTNYKLDSIKDMDFRTVGGKIQFRAFRDVRKTAVSRRRAAIGKRF